MSKKEKKILRSFMMITQISITMLVPIFISGWLGTWLNRLFGTQIIFPFMLLLGIGAAFKNVYILTKSFYEADMKKEHEQLDYMKGLTEKREEAAGEHETGTGTVMMALYYGMLPIFVKIGIPSALHVYFDLFSGVIQAYVFCMLTMTFVANKRNVEG